VSQARKGEEEPAGQPDWLRSEGPRAASQALCDSRLLEYNVARTLTVLAETQGALPRASYGFPHDSPATPRFPRALSFGAMRCRRRYAPVNRVIVSAKPEKRCAKLRNQAPPRKRQVAVPFRPALDNRPANGTM